MHAFDCWDRYFKPHCQHRVIQDPTFVDNACREKIYQLSNTCKRVDTCKYVTPPQKKDMPFNAWKKKSSKYFDS